MRNAEECWFGLRGRLQVRAWAWQSTPRSRRRLRPNPRAPAAPGLQQPHAVPRRARAAAGCLASHAGRAAPARAAVKAAGGADVRRRRGRRRGAAASRAPARPALSSSFSSCPCYFVAHGKPPAAPHSPPLPPLPSLPPGVPHLPQHLHRAVHHALRPRLRPRLHPRSHRARQAHVPAVPVRARRPRPRGALLTTACRPRRRWHAAYDSVPPAAPLARGSGG
jgi:hypothetical protein